MLAAPPLQWWAPLTAAVYTAISLAVPNVFPFSRYRMYASAARRRVGAVPFFRAGGVEVSINDILVLRDCSGIDPESIWPKNLPCSMEWQLIQFQLWLRGHLAEKALVPGPVRIEFGYRIVSVGKSGRLAAEIKIVAQGTAHRC